MPRAAILSLQHQNLFGRATWGAKWKPIKGPWDQPERSLVGSTALPIEEAKERLRKRARGE